ncbi:MAG: hypothetical protein LBI69_01815 [Puniceicoccales bacterium]|jgi:MATE family multidrug resistance protein|nr:hypothetical protein [Puniceicoccales bacterium]
MNSQLTRHRPGSIWELWTLSWPLVIASAANMLMLFADRVVMSKYSSIAYQSLTGTATWWWVFYCTLLNIALIADVFVGRYNASKEYKKIGSVIWQTLWFSAATFPFLIAIAIWVAPYLLAEKLRECGLSYMRILLVSTPISVAAAGGFGAFFTGQGKTRTILYIAAACNVINILLDLLFVFGFGPFPERGVTGAGIATALTQIIEFAAFAAIIFRKKNAEKYGIFKWRFDGKIIRQLLHIGLPNAADCFINGILWSCLIQVAAMQVSHEQFSVFCICHSIFCLLFFYSEGIGQGVAIVLSNAYGSRNWQMARSNTHSWTYLTLIAAVASFFILVIYPDPIVSMLRPSDSVISPSILFHMLILMWICFVMESYAFNLRMGLTAFGDTRFIMFANCLCYSIFFAIPGYIGLYIYHDVRVVGMAWAACYTALSIICFPRLLRNFRIKENSAKKLK